MDLNIMHREKERQAKTYLRATVALPDYHTTVFDECTPYQEAVNRLAVGIFKYVSTVSESTAKKYITTHSLDWEGI